MFAAAVWWLRPVGTAARFDTGTAWLGPVSSAVVEASQRHAFVIPGAEGRLRPASTVARTGQIDVDRDVDAALAALARRYDSGTITQDELHWLIGGYIATGLYAHARDYASAAMRRS